ncbi:NmrA-domain-containing protein [Mycena polygramma]|nr:NmrA-domain-containing protein [Mycena polygramma]
MTISTSSTAPLVAIIGITGNQGGSVARALKESNKPYRIRGLARDAQKLAAQAFAELGAKIVSVSLTIGNEASVRATFSGANIIFAVTNFNEHFDKERVRSPYLKSRRKAHGEGGVSLFVWSGLESFTKLSGGRISGAAFLDSKAAIFDYARASGIPPAIVQAGYHTTNVLSSVSYTLQPQADDSFLYRLPMTGSARVPLIDVESDFGLYVRAAIESPTLAAGSEPLSGQLVSLDDLIAELTKGKVLLALCTR